MSALSPVLSRVTMTNLFRSIFILRLHSSATAKLTSEFRFGLRDHASPNSITWRGFARRPPINNPGMNKRLKLLSPQDCLEDGEDFDAMESDFMDVHESHKDIAKEEKYQRDQLAVWIIKNKYFKSSSINLLTYAEKEQIRHLHQTDPEEWPPEKLASSFPATEDTIIKIIKSKWQIRDAVRAQKHDEAVKRNWEALKADKVAGIGPEVRTHLLKFVNRNMDTTAIPKVEEMHDRLKLPMGEFAEIIASFKAPQTEMTQKQIPSGTRDNVQPTPAALPPARPTTDDDTFVVDKIRSKEPITIELFKHKHGLSNSRESTLESTHSNHSPLARVIKTARVNEMEVVSSQFVAGEVDTVQERIFIPQKLRKRGATFKLNDCYYDDDGEFLYRVPGMYSV